MTGGLAVALRDLQWPDLAAAAAIEAETFPGDAWSIETFWSELAGVPDRARYFGLVSGGDLIGYAGLAFLLPDAHLQTVSVAGPAQGRGLGRRLLAAVIAAARDVGAERLLLEVRPDNAPARALYAEAGFHQLGTRPGYYPGGSEALVLCLDLAPAEPAEGVRDV